MIKVIGQSLRPQDVSSVVDIVSILRSILKIQAHMVCTLYRCGGGRQ